MGPLIEAKWEAFAQLRAKGMAQTPAFRAAHLTRNSRNYHPYKRMAQSSEMQSRIREIRSLLAWGAGPDQMSQNLAAAARKAASLETPSGILAAGRLLEMMLRLSDAGRPGDQSFAPPASPSLPQPLSAEEWDSKYGRRQD